MIFERCATDPDGIGDPTEHLFLNDQKSRSCSSVASSSCIMGSRDIETSAIVGAIDCLNDTRNIRRNHVFDDVQTLLDGTGYAEVKRAILWQ